MNNCLNCGKEVTNKYCGVRCQNEHKGKVNKEKYYLNPKLCEYCNKVIDYEYRRNKFCGHSCAAIKNNQGVNRKINSTIIFNKYNLVTDEEFIELINKAESWKDIALKLGYSERVPTKSRKIILDKAKSFGLIINFSKDSIKNKTKKEIFELSKNWQSARTTIRKDACKVFENSGKEYKCAICNYDKHVEIAHIKAVSEFSDDSTLVEINNINNLIALCPNHHWEYDNNLINLQ